MAREGEEQANTEDFKLDEAEVNQLFSGTVVSLKRNIDQATAERIFQRLADAGAMTKIVPAQHKAKPADQSDLDNQSSEKSFTLAPLGSDVTENAVIEEQDQQLVSLDHLGLEPVGSNLIEEGEREAIEPKLVDTSHLTLE